MLRSIRFRLTVWYVLLLALILAVFSAGVYFALRETLYSNLDDSVDARARILDATIDVNNGEPHISPENAPRDPEGEDFIRIFDSTGRVVFDNTNEDPRAPTDPDDVDAALSGSEVRKSVASTRVLTKPIVRDDDTIGAIQIGLSEDDIHDTLSTLLLIIAIAYPLTLIAATAGGAFLAGRALSPIDRLTGVARRITAEDLNQRIDLDLPDDEVGRLARTFNDMIARLDESFRRQRQFTADASHELRTPLTAIKGQTEVALQRDRNIDDYKQVLQTVNQDADRMIRMVASLLTLARADAGQIPIAREPVDIGGVVSDAVEQVRAAAVTKGLTLQVEPGPTAHVLADHDLLLQLLLNLLDNAIKYTPPGGSVRAGWALADGTVEMRVTDSGPGIAAEHLPRIFDRFYRADAARSGLEGAGLGLSISRWIAEAHGGTIDAESTPRAGSTFTVRLPTDYRRFTASSSKHRNL